MAARGWIVLYRHSCRHISWRRSERPWMRGGDRHGRTSRRGPDARGRGHTSIRALQGGHACRRPASRRRGGPRSLGPPCLCNGAAPRRLGRDFDCRSGRSTCGTRMEPCRHCLAWQYTRQDDKLILYSQKQLHQTQFAQTIVYGWENPILA